MNINLHLLREAHINNVIRTKIVLIKRAGSKDLKNPNILFLNGEKGALTRYIDDTAAKLLSRLDDEYQFTNTFGVHPCDVAHTHRKILTVLSIQYKANIVIYRTKTSGYYSKYKQQIVGIQFEDKKYMMKFLIKYGHFIC